jgi:hypothetical protein
VFILKSNWKALQVANLATFLGMILVNALANILPINGITTGEVSDSYPDLFAPAGFTFSIWLVIYLLLGAFVVYQAKGLLSGKDVREKTLAKVGIYFAASSLFNMAWIFAWHYQRIGWSLVLMILIFASLAVVYVRLGEGKKKASREEVSFVYLPFSVYFGWITVATIANVTAYLVSIGWQGWGLPESFWTVLVILVGALVATMHTLKWKDSAYLLVFIWAFIGIAAKRIGATPVYYSIIFAITASIALFIALFYRYLIPRSR